MNIEIPICIPCQSDDTTCGPTTLHAAYGCFGHRTTLEEVIGGIEKREGGSRRNVHLAVHALRCGYEVTSPARDVGIFDPTSFQHPTDLRAKLRARWETGLYPCPREMSSGPDDVAGDAFGHFVVVCGYRSRDLSVAIADPLKDNPLDEGQQYYRASVYRLMGAILLGARTNDANTLAVRAKGWRRCAA